MYIGVNNVARQIKSAYVGVNGVARKVKAVYVGVNGVARLVWQAIKKQISTIKGSTQVGIANDTLSLRYPQAICRLDDNHYLVGVYADYDSDRRRCFLYNCFLNDDGSVSSFTRFETNYEHTSNYQATINSMAKFNDSYGAVISTTYYSSGSGSDVRRLHVFDLNNSSSYLANTEVQYGTLDYKMPLISLNYDSVLFPFYSSSGYVYGRIYRYKDGALTSVYYNALTNGTPSYYSPIMYGECLAFPLSNDRFGTIYTVKDNGASTATADYMRIIVCIYKYSFDSSSGNMTVTNLTNHTLPWSTLQSIAYLDDDYFVVAGYDRIFGFHIDLNNNITTTNTVTNTSGYATRIGNTDSVYCTFGSYANIYYYDKTANTITHTYSGTGDAAYFNAPYKEQAIMYCSVPSSTQLAFNSMTFD